MTLTLCALCLYHLPTTQRYATIASNFKKELSETERRSGCWPYWRGKHPKSGLGSNPAPKKPSSQEKQKKRHRSASPASKSKQIPDCSLSALKSTSAKQAKHSTTSRDRSPSKRREPPSTKRKSASRHTTSGSQYGRHERPKSSSSRHPSMSPHRLTSRSPPPS